MVGYNSRLCGCIPSQSISATLLPIYLSVARKTVKDGPRAWVSARSAETEPYRGIWLQHHLDPAVEITGGLKQSMEDISLCLSFSLSTSIYLCLSNK